jgi:y4mF family transcriptional regulator
MDSESFGLMIREKRKQMNITQEYLAAIVKTGVRFISDLENGKATAQLGKALMVAAALNIELGWVEK